MTIEHARAHAVPKSWGVVDLRPWSNARHDDGAIGEIWYERSGEATTDSSLRLKLLFTNQPLSIQVHPDDAFARSMGLPNGKTEAWYVLSAVPEAKVALGLRRSLSLQEFRRVVDDGSISNLVVWRAVVAGDVILVPAGTIHAIGAGVVIAEIQQHSDTTFRLFDYGRQRELHVENAVAVANIGPAESQVLPTRLTHERTLLASSPHFVFERIDLAPNSTWSFDAAHETWLLVIDGDARAESFDVAKGDAIFAQSDRLDLHVGDAGMTGLVAYTGCKPVSELLRNLEPQSAINTEQQSEARLPKFQSHEQTVATTTAGRQQK
jgi:mannose-6-phosphate isomerase